MKTKKILLLDEVHPDFPAMLEQNGFIADIAEVQDAQELKQIISGYYGLVVRSSPQITSEIIDAAEDLKFIARAGSGIESIDYGYARSKGIEVLHSPEGNCDAVGEHALGLTICLLKNIHTSSTEVQKGQWNREANRGTELMGKTVGIIGYGNTGSAFTRKLTGMGVKILAYDKYKTGFANEFVQEATLAEILKKSDIISFHVPLTQETVYYANAEFFRQCAKPVLLLNTSRGKVVSAGDLAEAMKSGIVFAAGLDVVEWETYHFDAISGASNQNAVYLLNSPSVIITPHIAGITHEAKAKHAKILLNKMKQLQP